MSLCFLSFSAEDTKLCYQNEVDAKIMGKLSAIAFYSFSSISMAQLIEPELAPHLRSDAVTMCSSLPIYNRFDMAAWQPAKLCDREPTNWYNEIKTMPCWQKLCRIDIGTLILSHLLSHLSETRISTGFECVRCACVCIGRRWRRTSIIDMIVHRFLWSGPNGKQFCWNRNVQDERPSPAYMRK